MTMRTIGIEVDNDKLFNARSLFTGNRGEGFLDTASENGWTDRDEHKRLMKRWYGLTPADDDKWMRPCPNDLVEGDHGLYEPMCHCHRWPISEELQSVWDHPRQWTMEDRTPVITLEPYGFPRIDVITDYVSPIGIRVGFEGRSPYGASYVLFLIGSKKIV